MNLNLRDISVALVKVHTLLVVLEKITAFAVTLFPSDIAGT